MISVICHLREEFRNYKRKIGVIIPKELILETERGYQKLDNELLSTIIYNDGSMSTDCDWKYHDEPFSIIGETERYYFVEEQGTFMGYTTLSKKIVRIVG